MPLTAAIADRAFRLDHLFDTRQVFGKRSPVGLARAGFARDQSLVGFLGGLEAFDRCLYVFQGQFELIRIGLLRPAPEQRALDIGQQLLQLRDALDMAFLAPLGG